MLLLEFVLGFPVGFGEDFLMVVSFALSAKVTVDFVTEFLGLELFPELSLGLYLEYGSFSLWMLTKKV